MFSDKRSKRVVLVAHCVLNQNVLSAGTADFPACFREIVDLLADSDVGILQMRCPELMCLGLARESSGGEVLPVLEDNTRIRSLMDRESVRTKIREMVRELVFQIQEYRSQGFEICGVISVNRSPSCGVETTTVDNREVPGEGVFIRALKNELQDRAIKIQVVGIKTSEPQRSREVVRSLLGDRAECPSGRHP